MSRAPTVESEAQFEKLCELLSRRTTGNISDLTTLVRAKYEWGVEGFVPEMLWKGVLNIEKAWNERDARNQPTQAVESPKKGAK